MIVVPDTTFSYPINAKEAVIVRSVALHIFHHTPGVIEQPGNFHSDLENIRCFMFLNGLHNEKEILSKLSAGSEKAFHQLYEYYSVRIYSSLLKLLKSDSLAEELLQEVFITVWDHRERLDGEKSFRSYLFRIAENKVYDLFRKAARNKKLHAHFLSRSKHQYSHIEENLLSKENAGILQRAIDSLPPQRRQVFRLCKIDCKSYDEVSRQLGISTSTICDHIVKANSFIRKFLYRSHDIAKAS